MVDFIFSIVICAQFFLLPVVIGIPSKPSHNVSKMVYGGFEAKEGQFPYQAYVSKGDKMCGGSIYDANTIITAAHCVFDENKQRVPVREFEIYAGSTEPERGQQRLARYVKPHENYDPNKFMYDIAVIGLSQPLSFSKNVQPIPPTPSGKTLQPGTTCVLSGFGSTTGGEGFAGNLRYATIRIQKDSNCDQYYDEDEWNPSSTVCAGGDGTNSCGADSGGPLACRIQGKVYHYGVVSMGPKYCGPYGHAGTYSKISHYNSWIRQNIR